jgi:hypothetical protein
VSLSSEQADFNPYFIFPCYGKRPCPGVKWREQSTNDPLEIRRLQIKYPSAVWAIDLDKSGLICIDCDKDGDNDGFVWLSGFFSDRPGYLDKVPGALSPSGGRHCYFRNPLRLGCSRGSLPAKSVCNIDVKGVGGYVIMPGQTTPGADGGRYTPIGSFVDAFDLPDNLAKVLMGPERHPVDGSVAGDHLPPLEGAELARCLAYGKALLEGACRDVAAAPEGTRNQTANDKSLRVGHFVGGGCIGHSEALGALQAAVRVCHPAGDPDLPKTLETVRRALLDGMAEPMRPPPETDAPEVKLRLIRGGQGGTEGPEAEPVKDDLSWYGVDEVDAVQAWLVKDMLPEVGVILLSARRKMGKTAVALDLLGSAITGLPFAGHEIVRQCGALYVAVEGVRNLPMRLRALVEGKLKTDAKDLPEGYLDRPPIAWIRHGKNDINLQDPASVTRLRANIGKADKQMQEQQGRSLGLVFIDTMNRAAKFRDGNDAAEAQKVMDILADIAEQAKCLIVVLDHYGKDEDRGTKGSSNKEDSADVVLVLQGNAKTGRRSLKVALSRVGEEGMSVSYTIERYVSEKHQDKSFFVRFGERRKPADDDEDENGQIDSFVAAGEARQWGPGEAPQELRKALDFVLAGEQARRDRPYGAEGPEYLVAEMSAVRNEFSRTYGGDDQNKIANAFDKAVARAVQQKLVGKRAISGVKYLWLIK